MRVSAGILLYRQVPALEVLIAHPGGPFWAKRDDGVWTIPKGEVDPGEELLVTAKREFTEEIGIACPVGDAVELGSIVQKAGKEVVAWALEGDLDPDEMMSNTFTMEWPPRSGLSTEFPEIDRVAWVTPAEARQKLNPAQTAFVDRLTEALA